MLGLAVLAAAQTLATWRADLMAGRRRLRVLVLLGAVAWSVAVFLHKAWPASVAGFSIWSIASPVVTWMLLGLPHGAGFRRSKCGEASGALPAAGHISGNIKDAPPAREDKPLAADPELLRRLQQLMTVERAYRREGLTIGSLSAEFGVQEYRLRQLINEGLGYRNFNAFLNHYRLEDASSALADPAQKQVPVLTIADGCRLPVDRPVQPRLQGGNRPDAHRIQAPCAGQARVARPAKPDNRSESASRTEESASRILNPARSLCEYRPEWGRNHGVIGMKHLASIGTVLAALCLGGSGTRRSTHDTSRCSKCRIFGGRPGADRAVVSGALRCLLAVRGSGPRRRCRHRQGRPARISASHRVSGPRQDGPDEGELDLLDRLDDQAGDHRRGDDPGG